MTKSRPDKFRWNLEDLYPSRTAWERDLKRLRSEVRAFTRRRGKMGRSAKQLAEGLDRLYTLTKRLYRLHVYAMRFHDQDARVTAGQVLKDRVQKAATEVSAALSFVEPEILGIPPRKLSTWLKSERLRLYRHNIRDVARRRAHILGPKQEELIARAGDLAAMPTDVYQTLATVNLPYPEVKLRTAGRVTLTPPMYSRYRALRDRGDRLRVFRAFWGVHGEFKEAFAALLSGVVSRDRYYADARKYKSDLRASLDHSRVPVSIYTNMIKQVRGGLPLLRRYLELRKQALGIDDLGYHDLYASIVPAVKMEIPYPEAREIVLDSLNPLGGEYTAALRQAYDQSWVDVYPAPGKRSGAYSSGDAYDVHPYLLLNYNDDYESMSIMAHEFGHALHSHLSNRSQPFHLADYPTFVAEVASTVNENLLRLHLVAKEPAKNMKIFLLGQHLENFRTTVFRQCLFAEFELKIHEIFQAGLSLTADGLGELYLQLLRKYYGEAQGVIRIDPLYAVEWAFVPHFYYNFYTFQYTTSFVAATAIADRIFEGDARARRSYLKMLKAGGSRYPVQLLKMAGVDMQTAAPYQRAFASMKRTLDEIEELSA
jgi:oligoendopeptidase F